MSPTKTRITIAEACGYHVHFEGCVAYASRSEKPDFKCRIFDVEPLVPNYEENLNAAQMAVLKLTEIHGWSFQEPYTVALEAVVLRKRQQCNPAQVKFWIAQATAAQRCEAIIDALAVMEATNQTHAH